MRTTNATCFLSHLPIRDGDPVAGVFISATSAYSPPILGLRDKDKGITDIQYDSPQGKARLAEALDLVRVRDFCGRVLHANDPADLVRIVHSGKACGPGAMPMGLALCHRGLYDYAVGSWALSDGDDGRKAVLRHVPGYIRFPDDAAKARAMEAWRPLACLEEAMAGLNLYWHVMLPAAPLDGRTKGFYGKVAEILDALPREGA